MKEEAHGTPHTSFVSPRRPGRAGAVAFLSVGAALAAAVFFGISCPTGVCPQGPLLFLAVSLLAGFHHLLLLHLRETRGEHLLFASFALTLLLHSLVSLTEAGQLLPTLPGRLLTAGYYASALGCILGGGWFLTGRLRRGERGSLIWAAALGLGSLLLILAGPRTGPTIPTVAGIAGFLAGHGLAATATTREITTEIQELLRGLTSQTRERDQLFILAGKDELTELHNRRRGNEALTHEIHRYVRYQTPLAIVVIDLDHFKQINDTWGHQVGDEVLRGFAGILRASTRSSDVLCRWGGEEFLVLLPDTPPAAAVNLAEKLRAATARTPLETRAGALKITLSAGVAGLQARSSAETREIPLRPGDAALIADALLRDADGALYQAKEEGRDRVCLPRTTSQGAVPSPL
ncbi:hypothetical protein AU468_08390 [Alkalispirochaeta sphaeroplastigenens]|uniref:diguanylate cyclase n=1 Tax=Alkalispirochaeta sphaeroplastigenens TaxID=1187066 RepID=A0A2S4JP91_9SPIO|nr:GGDEF domain-containing protein [Alkalispirochaeta sphaeroplastigenens]POR01326.1 hypothetical protein AU468_08390 [Alkalispirochaeta sphaeroplastigenens]